MVIHSLTKFVGGHGTTLGGIIIDAGTFPWAEHPERFGCLNEPEPAFHGVRTRASSLKPPAITRCRTIGLRSTGASLSPFGAFQHPPGPRDVGGASPAHEGQRPAESRPSLSTTLGSSWVSFLGLPDNPYHELARRYLGERVPSIMTFAVHGGYEAGIAVFNRVKLFKRLLNMGDAKSMITHPASTTHRQLTPDGPGASRDHTGHGAAVDRARAPR